MLVDDKWRLIQVWFFRASGDRQLERLERDLRSRQNQIKNVANQRTIWLNGWHRRSAILWRHCQRKMDQVGKFESYGSFRRTREVYTNSCRLSRRRRFDLARSAWYWTRKKTYTSQKWFESRRNGAVKCWTEICGVAKLSSDVCESDVHLSCFAGGLSLVRNCFDWEKAR